MSISFIGAFSPVVGFLDAAGAHNCAGEFLCRFSGPDDGPATRKFNLVLSLHRLMRLAREGVLPEKPTGTYWEKLAQRLAPRYFPDLDGIPAPQAGTGLLHRITINEADLESACRALHGGRSRLSAQN